jgi:hypothetical protein
MEETDNEFYIRGHDLTDDEIWKAIDAHNQSRDGEFFAEASAGELQELLEIKYKLEEWYRWVLCTCGDDHARDLSMAKPHTRGAFPATRVGIK